MALDRYEINGLIAGIALSLLLAFLIPVPPMRAHNYITFAQLIEWELSR